MDLIRDLSNAFGPSGFEEDVIEVVEKYSGDFNFKRDVLNNAYLSLKNPGGDFNLMLDGHLDEVGFMVHYIDPKGLIHFIALGGWVVENIPAQLVVIKNARGDYIKGVVSSKPPHFMTEEERKKRLTIEDLTIDVGACSKEEVEGDFGIQVGDPIAPYVDFDYNEKNQIMMGKAFDNRLGTACAIKLMERLKDEKLKLNPIAALASQEEVGTRGAQVTSQRIRPDLAIVFEGSPADDLYYPDYRIQGGLNKGAQIRLRDSSYLANRKLAKRAIDIADKKNIDYQVTVRTSGGTNAGKIHLSHEGVAVLVIGIPVRYAHSHHCYASKRDFDSAVDLAYELIMDLNSELE